MSSPGGNIVRVDADLLVGGLVGASILLVFVPIAWIFIYHVLKDRKADKKRRKANARAGDLEEGRAGELEADGIGSRGLYELEQPGMPELEGEDVKEMWEERCAEEKDGRMVAVEMDGRAGLDSRESTESSTTSDQN